MRAGLGSSLRAYSPRPCAAGAPGRGKGTVGSRQERDAGVACRGVVWAHAGRVATGPQERRGMLR
eukprot:scaffold2580_cov388-Prasinococcus_capsulatus_cf.AAC.3